MFVRRAVTPIRLRDDKNILSIKRGGAKTFGQRNTEGPLIKPLPAIVPNPTIESFDTTIGQILESTVEFDTPENVLEWFRDPKNYFSYLYGVGKILKTKEQMLIKLSNSLKEQIEKVNSDYDTGIREIKEVVPSLNSKDPDREKKEKLIDGIVEKTNNGYTTQFNELLLKKIRYDETINKLRNRRAFIVYCMNTDDQGFKDLVLNKIMPVVEDLYAYYRGVRYRDIRKMIFSYVKICAYNPEIIEKSFILNTSITGPAGSGKTTLARKLAIWFTTVGFLTNDSFLDNVDLSYREVGAPQLIAEYVGQTAPMTQGVLYSSLEQCLFIDEAYSVAGCSFDAQGKLESSQYGEEFIAVLLPFMANHQGIGNIIVAGYKNLMEACFFQRNEGLPRRFPTKIDLPLYTTDELYDMFLNFNIIKRQASSIKDIEKKKEFRRGKQIIYIGIKPAFLMFHYDTSYTAFEILRKYLLLYQVRKQQFEEGRYTKPVPTHSYTIINHVLTNVLSSPLRRNIVRYYFYKKVFGFETQNLSWFPAQAGEMGLVADMVNRLIEVEMNQEKRNNIFTGYISIERETKVFDTYFESKSPRIVYFKEENKPMYVEVIKRGYENEKAKFQDKISEILITPILGTLLTPANATASNGGPALASLAQENSPPNFVFGGPNVEAEPAPPPAPAPAPVPAPAPAPAAAAANEPLRGPGVANEPLRGPGFPNEPQQGGLRLGTVPSLQEVWELLFKNTVEILTFAVQNYVTIADQVIPELLQISENKFPVNMLKSEVYNEQTLVDFYKKSGSDSGLFKTELESFLSAKDLYVGKDKKVTLQNTMLLVDSPSEKTIKDALWEDFGFKESD